MAGRLSRAARAGLDLVLAGALLYVGSVLVGTAVGAADRRERLRLLQIEARALREAFNQYYARNGGYPSSYAEPRFDLTTLDPLRRRGYYRGNLQSHLHRRRADAYDSPDDVGPNQEFWLELSLAGDPRTRVLVANSDDSPLGGGRWLDGVFLCRDGTLQQI